jgi:hypothetical protein
VHQHLWNDSSSFHPGHPLIRAFGPKVLHHAKGHCRERTAGAGWGATDLGGPIPAGKHITKRLPILGRFAGCQLQAGEQGEARHLEQAKGYCMVGGIGDRPGSKRLLQEAGANIRLDIEDYLPYCERRHSFLSKLLLFLICLEVRIG